MTAVISTHCRGCHRELRDRFSRMLGYGPECRKGMTDAQLRAAVARNDPAYTPPAAVRPASAQARRNQAEVQRITAPEPAAKLCAAHSCPPASCALCRRDNDPWRTAERIITLTQRIPMDQRIELQRAAATRRYRPDTQLTIGA